MTFTILWGSSIAVDGIQLGRVAERDMDVYTRDLDAVNGAMARHWAQRIMGSENGQRVRETVARREW